MNLFQQIEVFYTLARSIADIQNRSDAILLREATISSISPIVKLAFKEEKNAFEGDRMQFNKTAFERDLSVFTKNAFDTRRINQETDFIPRRNLQNYHRSESFISEAQEIKINNFSRLKNILGELKDRFEKQYEWQDSYCRVLLNTLNQSLRIVQGDNDFSNNQPSIGSFDYVEELLFARYRLDMNSIQKYSNEELKSIFLSKDENLIRKNSILPTIEISKHDVAHQSYDTLIEKLFGGVKATKDNKNVERTVTITIKDTFLDEDKEDV